MALYHAVQGSVDYTIVGTPTIEDGVASDFSSSNYLGLNTTFDPKTPYKMQVKFKFTSVPDEYGTFFGVATTGIFNFGIRRQNSKLTLQIGNGRFDWDVVSLEGTTTLQANTDYWAQAEFTGTQYILRLSTDGVNWNEENKAISSTVPSPGNPFALQIGDGHTNWYFGGSIDLKKTYIKIDGQPWFGICPVEVKKHQIKGPVGYTAVGSPTIADGIVSGFTYNDYFVTAQQISTTGISSFEFYARVKTPSAFSGGWCRICSAGNLGGGGTTAGIFGGSGGASPYFHLFGRDIWQQLLTTDTWYRIQYICSQTEYTATVYDDNGNVLKSFTANNPSLNLQGVINFCQRYQDFVLGAIDLNNTYIKVNGKMWFYQPANTKYIVKDGRLVWADPSIYLQSDGNQCIDTGIIFKANTIFEVDAFFDNMNDNRWCGGTNYIIATNTNRFPTRISSQWYDDYAQAVTSGKHKILLSIASSSFQLIVDDIIQQDISRTFLDDGSTFYIGKSHNGARGGLSGKSYGYKIFQNNELVRHFVPVPAGLVIGNFTVPSNGMFDIVNQQFYANQGTGEFTIGKDS